MSISLRDFVPEQGRKTEFGGPNEAFSDAALGEKIQRKGIGYFLSVPKIRNI